MGKRKTTTKKQRHSPRGKAEQIHYTMSRIRGKDTKIEIVFRRALWRSGIRYRKNFAVLPGKPDIAITKYKIAVFCDGEFWHGKDWASQKSRLHSNRDFWVSKIEKTMARDNKTDMQLERLGWYVLRFWGGEIKENLDACVKAVEEAIIRAQIDSSGALYPPGDIDGEEEPAAAERGPEYCPPGAHNTRG
jgi:DNA mismatch endonuclease (patch repair protein)